MSVDTTTPNPDPETPPQCRSLTVEDREYLASLGFGDAEQGELS